MSVVSRSRALDSSASALVLMRRLVLSHSSVMVRHAEAIADPGDDKLSSYVTGLDWMTKQDSWKTQTNGRDGYCHAV